MVKVKYKIYRQNEDRREEVFSYHATWPYFTVGFGDEKDYFVENLSLLVSSGMGIGASLSSVKEGIKNKQFKKMITAMEEMVSSGYPLWRAFEYTRFLPSRIIALVKSGEESGHLPEHLNLVTIQQHKEKVFTSRLRSALLYPGIVFLLAILVGIGSAWFVLPKLVSVFGDLNVRLPLPTRMLIGLANFITNYGFFAIPIFIVLLLYVVYLLFVNKRTKFLGEYLTLVIPGVNRLVQGVELARFGFIFGALLQAGLTIGDALDSVREGTGFVTYQKFYTALRENIQQGQSFRQSLTAYKGSDKFIPMPMQQLIMAAEKSGKLPETMLKIGQIFEEKTEVMSQDLSTILEPIVLIVVGLIVGVVVIAVISPIYNIVNQI